MAEIHDADLKISDVLDADKTHEQLHIIMSNLDNSIDAIEHAHGIIDNLHDKLISTKETDSDVEKSTMLSAVECLKVSLVALGLPYNNIHMSTESSETMATATIDIKRTILMIIDKIKRLFDKIGDYIRKLSIHAIEYIVKTNTKAKALKKFIDDGYKDDTPTVLSEMAIKSIANNMAIPVIANGGTISNDNASDIFSEYITYCTETKQDIDMMKAIVNDMYMVISKANNGDGHKASDYGMFNKPNFDLLTTFSEDVSKQFKAHIGTVSNKYYKAMITASESTGLFLEYVYYINGKKFRLVSGANKTSVIKRESRTIKQKHVDNLTIKPLSKATILKILNDVINNTNDVHGYINTVFKEVDDVKKACIDEVNKLKDKDLLVSKLTYTVSTLASTILTGRIYGYVHGFRNMLYVINAYGRELKHK